MRAKFTQRDSDGNLTHSKLTRTVDGERAVMRVASTGTIQGPENVIQALIDDPGSEVEPLEEDEDKDEGSDIESESDTDSNSGSESESGTENETSDSESSDN